MKFSAKLQIPSINLSAFSRELDSEFNQAITAAARVWLQATTVEIPVWSGASLATFAKLASDAGFALAGLTPVATAPVRIGMGLNASQGSLEANKGKGEYKFTYATSLRHLIYNEFNNANISPDSSLFGTLKKPGPYRFQEKGAAAVDRVFGSIAFPKLTDFIKVTKLK